MKVLFFGHSDTSGVRLPSAEDACSRVIERRLAARGIHCSTAHKELFPGPTATAYFEKQLEIEQPDVVVIAVFTYGVLIQTVSKRVQECFGSRAATLAERAEQFAARHPGPPGSRRATAFTEVRRVGRRIIGTQGEFSAEGLIACYVDCFRAVAQRENVQGIVIGAAGFTDAVWRMNRGAEELEDRLQAQVAAAAREHRLDWVSHRALLGGPRHKLPYYQADGVHTDARSHQLLAEAVVEQILARA